ncbi:hypothetical protein [Thauera propionica]|jgi:hypothetical protein|uniref:hypothetical protein n=1 Tax=Thauera propionica TaxID=2019431 RepID=UPI0023F46C8A|nr:hypothetical protein [Thauera propionica]MDD3676948.1 hypothetical protein [Thauera propionica]
MSTKASLNYCVDDASGTSAHLYDECLAPADSAVYLELSGVSELSVDVTTHGTNLTVAIPRELAAGLRLIPAHKGKG